MQLKQLFTDDEAVSPVIGVILMVAITVILAAVIGTFVLGLGNQVGNNAPQASFTTDFTDEPSDATADYLKITHNGGTAIKANMLDVKSGSTTLSDADSGSGTTGTSFGWEALSSANAQSDVSAGDTATVYGNDELNSATIRLIWTSEGGDSSAELAKWTGPDA